MWREPLQRPCERSLLGCLLLLNPLCEDIESASQMLDRGFTALSDPTRRGILERLGRGDTSISDLAANLEITLTGIKKHVQILEGAGLVTTEKVGRVRTCRLGPRRLEDETAWIAKYRQMLEARLDRLGEFLERTKGSES
jgi:DNA-binding transcriptional ArsR family regulator